MRYFVRFRYNCEFDKQPVYGPRLKKPHCRCNPGGPDQRPPKNGIFYQPAGKSSKEEESC